MKKIPLGCTLLVSRPELQSRQLANKLEQLGYRVLQLPVLDLQPLNPTPKTRELLLNLDQCDAIICISAHAAKMLLQHIDTFWPQIPPHLQWFAVGPATAKVLADAGLPVCVSGEGDNSEALLSLAELQAVTEKSILIAKGEGGRELLATTLQERGAKVSALNLYRRAAISYSDEQFKERVGSLCPHVALATSVDILRAQQTLLSRYFPNWAQTLLIVASERIGEQARALGYRQVRVAEGASDEAIIKALNVIA